MKNDTKSLARIWAFHGGPMVGYFVGQDPGKGVYVAEYVRTDCIKELQSRLAKAEVIVRIIASDKWDERLGEAADLSCEYLAELMGDEDDD